jgi:glycosyltransferase involved in cell wall biosynthesis
MIVIASRHFPWKRIDLAFHILKKLDSKMPRLLVTGEETAHTYVLKEIVKKLGLSQNVHFTGHLADDELFQTYSQARTYMQTSINEPFGMSTIEAQSLGTPAVVWGDAGTKETVLDGETGFHAIPYDMDDFSSKVGILMHDDALWRTMSHNAKIWATSFSWDSHVDLLEAVLDEERK